MKNTPLVIFTGMAIAALAALLGVTRDRWYVDQPDVAATSGSTLIGKTEPPKSGEPVQTITEKSKTSPAEEQAAAPAEPPGEQAAAPAEPPKTEEQAAAPTEAPTAGEQAAAPTEPPQTGEQAAAPAEPPKAEEQAAAPAEPPKTEEQAAAPAEPPKAEVQATAPAEPPKIEENAVATAEPPPAEIQAEPKAQEQSIAAVEPPQTDTQAAADSDRSKTEEKVAIAEPPQGEAQVPAIIEPPAVKEKPSVAAEEKPKAPDQAVAIAEPPKTDAQAPAVAEPPKAETPRPVAEKEQTDPPKVEEKPPEFAEAPKDDQPETPKTDNQSVTIEIPKAETARQNGAEAAKTPAEPAPQSTDKDAPGFDTVRVEKTGEAVIAGRAEAGSEVTVRHNGKAIGTAIANSEGAFVVVPIEPLPAGNGALTLEAKSTGDSVAKQASETVAVAVADDGVGETMVALVSPDKPTKVLQKPEVTAPPQQAKPDAIAETMTAAVQPEPEQPIVEKPAMPDAAPIKKQAISLDAVDYDEAGNIVFSGRGSSGSAVRLYVDNMAVGEAVTGGDGRWSYSGAAQIAPGTHRLRVDELAEGGGVASRVELPFFREEAAKVATAPPVEKPQAETAPLPQPPTETKAAETEITGPTPSPETLAALTEAPPIEAPRDGRVIIQPGNNLWKLSRVIYGKGMKYTVIYEANKDDIRDPDLIYPGQIFKTPDAVPPEKIDPVRREPLKPEEGGAISP